MGLFDLIFGNRPKEKGKYEGSFKMLNGYTPHFTTFNGSIYESQLIRSAINARATHIAKLKVEIGGAARPALRSKLQHAPNQFQTWYQFMYRLSTILDIHNTAFICPVYDDFGQVSGIICPLPQRCEVISYNNVPYLRYEFSNGQRAAIELDACGVMTKFQYRDDLFGESNVALFPTIDLIDIQNQGIKEGVKSAATYRFYAQVNNFTKADDLAKERKRFTEENFSKDAEGGGLLLFPNTYSNINQVKADPWVVDAEEENIIKSNVFDYFNVNEAMLQSKAYGDDWTAVYEGICEPFAIQFSEVVTKMLFTFREQTQGNIVIASANRLQYMSNKEKLSMSIGLADRGILNRDEVREIWNLPPLPNGEGQEYIIRGEYWNANEKINEGNTEGSSENE
jgi:hypothetical protein